MVAAYGESLSNVVCVVNLVGKHFSCVTGYRFSRIFSISAFTVAVSLGLHFSTKSVSALPAAGTGPVNHEASLVVGQNPNLLRALRFANPYSSGPGSTPLVNPRLR